MVRNSLLVFAALLLIKIPIYAQQIALTFDDAPRRDGNYFTGIQRTEMLIDKLSESGVKGAAFFCTTSHIDSLGDLRLKKYANADHIIANHSHKHPSLNRTNSQEFVTDLKIAHKKLRDYKTFKKWFRFPYLHEGNTIDKRDSLRKVLKEMNYINGYVTIDNYDWYFESLFQKALKENKKIDYEKLKSLYIEHIWNSVLFYDNIGKEHLGRSPRHVLLLHENDLAALFIGDLIDHFKSNGWDIISAEDAYIDPIASEIPDVIFNNQGRIAALANAKGVKPSELVQAEENTDYLDKLIEKEKVFE